MLIALADRGAIAGRLLLAAYARWAPGGWIRIERDFGYGLAAATVIGASQRCLSSWCIRGSRFL